VCVCVWVCVCGCVCKVVSLYDQKNADLQILQHTKRE